MEKLYFERIIEEIDQKCIDEPIKLHLKHTPHVQLSDSLKAIIRSFPYYLGDTESRFKRYYYKALYAVIYDGVYDRRIVTDKFRVPIKDIEITNNKYSHIWKYLRNQADYEEFVEYMCKKAKDIYVVENKKCIEFKQLPLIQQLTGTPPLLYSFSKIRKANQDLRELPSVEEEKQRVLNGDITPDERDEIMRKAKRDSFIPRNIITWELGRKKRHDRVAEKDYWYISSVPISVANGIGVQPHIIMLNASTVSKVELLLREYTRWFNVKYGFEIEEERVKNRNAKRRERYEQEQLPKKQKAKEIEKNNQTTIFNLYLKGTTNIREIAEQTGLSYYMVRKTVGQIKTLIEQQ